jgi:hypothetical protein
VTDFVNTCQVCGAEESLDSLILRMIDDDQTRGLIAEVLTRSLPLGGAVVRYLRLFKPAQQKLRIATVRKVLTELVPDMQRGSIERSGRMWQATVDGWRAAFAAVFEAQEKGTLSLPLQGNGYLYQVLMRLSDQVEGQQERQVEAERRSRSPSSAPAPVVAVAHAAIAAVSGEPPPRVESPLVRRMKAEIAASRRAPQDVKP